DYFQPNALAALTTLMVDLKNRAAAVKELAEKVVDAPCDAQVMREGCDAIGTQLTTLYTEYNQARCELDCLKRGPELEAPFLGDMQSSLDQAVYPLDLALRVLNTICVKEQNWVLQLQQAWQDLAKQTETLQAEIKCWAQSQSCPPADSCSGTAKCLRDLAAAI